MLFYRTHIDSDCDPAASTGVGLARIPVFVDNAVRVGACHSRKRYTMTATCHHSPNSHGQGRTQTRDAFFQEGRAAAAYSLDIPVFAVISACKAAVAQCESSLELQQVLESYSGSIREQGWTVLITECGKRGELDKAQQVFDAVPNKNVWHYSALLTATGACGQWRAALDLLEHLTQLSVQQPELQPNHVTYSAAIVACARGGRTDHVQRLFQEMLAAGLEPDSVTYYIVLSTCSRLGAWSMVDTLLQTMHAQGHAARITVYQTYIRHLCRTSQVSQAITTFLTMQDLDVPVTNDIVTELLSALNRCGKPCTAAYLLMQAADADLVEAGYVCEATYAALSQAGSEQQAQKLREHVAGCKQRHAAAAVAALSAEKTATGQEKRQRHKSPQSPQSPERGTQSDSTCSRGSPPSHQQQQQTYSQGLQQFDSPQRQQQLAQQYVQAMAWPCVPMPMHWLQMECARASYWGALSPLPPQPTSTGLQQTGSVHRMQLSPQHQPVAHSGSQHGHSPLNRSPISTGWRWSQQPANFTPSTSSSDT